MTSASSCEQQSSSQQAGPLALHDAGPAAPWQAVLGLIIDVPDVLYDATVWRRTVARRLARRLGVAASYDDFFLPWNRDYLADVDRGRRQFAEALASFLLAAGLSWGQIDEIEAASRVQLGRLATDARTFPGVARTLDQCRRQGLRLAAWGDVSQTAEQYAQHLGSLGLGSMFDAVLSSREIDRTQPELACYQACLDAIALPASAVAYVGHEPRHFAGAQQAGLRTVAVNGQCLAKVDRLLGTLHELPSLARPG